MSLKIMINGRFYGKEDAKISVFDHGLLYGDGVFEGIRAYSGRVFKLEEHIDRLYDSAKAIMLKIPVPKEKMTEGILNTLRENSLTDAYIRVVVTRGEGDLGLDPGKCPKATYFIIADKIVLYPKELYENGLAIATVSVRRNIPEALNPGVKSLNYLNNILAKIEGLQRGVPEALMLNAQGYVAECTGDNIFIVRKGVLVTPPSSAGSLEGITRNAVIGLAKGKGLEVSEKLFTRYNIFTADECFLTGTAAEVIPVVTVDGRAIGGGKPGKITKDLISSFRKLASETGAAI